MCKDNIAALDKRILPHRLGPTGLARLSAPVLSILINRLTRSWWDRKSISGSNDFA